MGIGFSGIFSFLVSCFSGFVGLFHFIFSRLDFLNFLHVLIFSVS